MTAPIPVAPIFNSGGAGMIPATIGTTGEFDATECDKILLLTNGTGLAAAEVVNIYVRNTGTAAVGGGPAGTTPYCKDGAAAPAQLTATLQSIVLEGGFYYVFSKSVTAGLCGVDIQIKRGNSQ